MKGGIRVKLFLLSVGLIGLSLFAAEAYLSRTLEEQLTRHIRDELLVRARLAAERVKGALAERPLRDERFYDALADEIGHLAGARVTLVRRDGSVAGDSEVEPARLRSLENHGSRPEIVAALEHGEGDSVRYSTTLHESMMYVAVPIMAAGSAVGTARLAMPLTSVEAALADLRRTLFAAALFALLVAAIASFTAVNVISRSLRHITETAKKMAAGNLSARTRVSGNDEVAALGRSLDELAETLSQSLGEVRSERDLLNGILSSMNEGVLVVAPDRRVALLNPALRSMLLVGPEAVGKTVLQVIRNAELSRVLEQAALGEATQAELELAGLKRMRALVRAVALREAPGGVLAVFVDVTELRRLESVRRDFVANASHELKSPLTTVRAALETLRAVHGEPEEALKFIELIERNTQRIENLVNDLLELARLESHELALHVENLDLFPFVERIVSRYAAQAKLKDIALVNDIAPETRVRADQRALDNLLGNLIDNALKYCPNGATVRIGAGGEDAMVRVSVTDNGPGISSQHLPRLFERFYRVDAGRSRELGGTGLGLSIVKHLAEAMGGTVAAESHPGAGAAFSFTLRRS